MDSYLPRRCDLEGCRYAPRPGHPSQPGHAELLVRDEWGIHLEAVVLAERQRADRAEFEVARLIEQLGTAINALADDGEALIAAEQVIRDLVDATEGLADQQAMPDDSYLPALNAARAYLTELGDSDE